jgi:phage protein D
VAGGWDVASKQALAESAGEDALRAELGNDESGASILSAVFGERKEVVAHGVPADQAEARALAEAAYRMLARRFVVARGIAETDAKLRVGAKLRLAGLGPLFSGEYRAAQVRHRFDGATGLRTEFVAERPGLGRP